jgi:hypothetical protein
MSTTPDSPTTLDAFNFAVKLQEAYSARLGIPAKHAPIQALIDGNIPAVDLARRLALGGLEMYADCIGNACIRTKEQGEAHRALVQAEKDLERIERQAHENFVSASLRSHAARYRPSEPTRVRDRDEDSE